MSNHPPRRESTTECPTTQTQLQPHGDKKAPSNEGAVGDDYSPLSNFLATSKDDCRTNSSMDKSCFSAASENIAWSSSGTVKAMIRKTGGFDGVASASKKALISFHFLSGMFVFENHPFIEVNDIPILAAKSLRLILCKASHDFSFARFVSMSSVSMWAFY